MQTFRTLDQNNDGVLSKEELVEGNCFSSQSPFQPLGILKNKNYLTPEEAQQEVEDILKQADGNNNSQIDYSEFIVACSKREELLSIDKMKKAFDMFDIDNNGYITKEEFMEVMGGLNADEGKWEELLHDFDVDNDKKVIP